MWVTLGGDSSASLLAVARVKEGSFLASLASRRISSPYSTFGSTLGTSSSRLTFAYAPSLQFPTHGTLSVKGSGGSSMTSYPTHLSVSTGIVLPG